MSKRKLNAGDLAVTHGSGNVFADLGFTNAEELKTKARLAFAINGILEEHGWSQAAAAEQLGLNQPKISALANYKLAGFSSGVTQNRP